MSGGGRSLSQRKTPVLPRKALPAAPTCFLIRWCMRSFFTCRASNAAFCMALCKGGWGLLSRFLAALLSQGFVPGEDSQSSQNTLM